MPISRKDLVDAGSPEALVKRILQAEPELPVPVSIQGLCACLGILKIEELDTDGFEGVVVTDAKRSEGSILAKRGRTASPFHHRARSRPLPDGASRSGSARPVPMQEFDLLRVTAKEGDQRQRREVEANRFAPPADAPRTFSWKPWRRLPSPIAARSCARARFQGRRGGGDSGLRAVPPRADRHRRG